MKRKQPLVINTKHSKKYNETFLQSHSFMHETWIIFQILFPICVAALAEYAPQVIINNIIGHLPNAAHAIATIGVARMFSALTGSIFVMGMLSDLYTTIPQSIGAQRSDLLHFYVQRAFCISFIIMIPLVILQFFADRILYLVGQPQDILHDTKLYCIYIIPNIYGKVWLYIVQRVAQSLNYNYIVLWSTIFCAVLIYPLTILFVFTFNFGFMGSAFALNFASLASFIMIAIYLCYKRYMFLFKPMFCSVSNIAKLCNKTSLNDYLTLSLPGLIQTTFEWAMMQIGTVLSGLIRDPDIAIAATTIMGLLNGICIMLCWGCYMAITIRVGKYVGAGMVPEAQRSCKAGVCISCSVSIVSAVLLYIFKSQIPYFFTNDHQIVYLVSDLIIVLCVLQFFMVIYFDLGAIYRGIGRQKTSAIIALVTYYGISLPITLVLLFVPEIGLSHDTLMGTVSIWGSLAFGNMIAAIGLFLYLICFIDWHQVIRESRNRVQQTSHLMDDKQQTYGAINE